MTETITTEPLDSPTITTGKTVTALTVPVGMRIDPDCRDRPYYMEHEGQGQYRPEGMLHDLIRDRYGCPPDGDLMLLYAITHTPLTVNSRSFRAVPTGLCFASPSPLRAYGISPGRMVGMITTPLENLHQRRRQVASGVQYITDRHHGEITVLIENRSQVRDIIRPGDVIGQVLLTYPTIGHFTLQK